jgi:hypothetical protein
MDDFQQAAAAAQAQFTAAAWAVLPVKSQARAIYGELRRIDAERLAAGLRELRPRPLPAGPAPTEQPSAPTERHRAAQGGQSNSIARLRAGLAVIASETSEEHAAP